jgi:hypothetical protein
MITHDYAALREACELVFRNRNTHSWPPDLSTVPAHWAQPFARLAEELGQTSSRSDRGRPHLLIGPHNREKRRSE